MTNWSLYKSKEGRAIQDANRAARVARNEKIINLYFSTRMYATEIADHLGLPPHIVRDVVRKHKATNNNIPIIPFTWD